MLLNCCASCLEFHLFQPHSLRRNKIIQYLFKSPSFKKSFRAFQAFLTYFPKCPNFCNIQRCATNVSTCYSSIHLPIHQSIYLSIHPSIHLPIHPSIHPFIYLSIHPSTHPPIHSSIHSLYPSVCPS